MRNNSGIALMMVISAIMLISMITLEFVYSSNVTYRLAVNEKERLQAYYLAESALNLMKLELRLDKQMKSAISSSPIAQYVTANMSAPMCQQFPFSTSLIRSFFIGGEAALFGGGGGEAEEPGEEVEREEKAKSVTSFETEKAEAFLSFEGDFDGICADEQSKFNLNLFSDLDPSQQTLSGANMYDVYKVTLVNFLKSNKFKKLFDGVPPEKIEEAVRNVADWTDKNDVINDLNNISRGNEDGIYKGDNLVRPKNAKFLSLDEIHLVDGIDDNWFMPIEDMFTVYGGSKVNVCLAPDEIVWSLIITYAGQNPNLPPIDPRSEDTKKRLIDTVKFSCSGAQPQVNKIASDLDAALNIGNENLEEGQAPQNTSGFSSLITTDSRYYSLKLSGQVGETVVNIKTVLDVRDPDPKRWKTLYYKVY